MTGQKGRRVAAVLLLLVPVVYWAIPSDVARLIARQDVVLLGRYDENRVYLGLLLTPLCLLPAALLLSRVRFDRQLGYRVLTVTLASVVTWLIVDVGARFTRKPRYHATAVTSLKKWPHKWKRQGDVRTRPPNQVYNVRFADRPPTRRSYPDAPKGFPRGAGHPHHR